VAVEAEGSLAAGARPSLDRDTLHAVVMNTHGSSDNDSQTTRGGGFVSDLAEEARRPAAAAGRSRSSRILEAEESSYAERRARAGR
jgi:hypothetical protein